jgi:hypothetical protein
MPAKVGAESALWTLIASPLAVATGSSTAFALSATNADPIAALSTSNEIGCIVLDVPANFIVAGAVVTGSNAGDSWHVDRIEANRVFVHINSGGDRLAYLGTVSFTVTATALSTGSLLWNATAYKREDCTGSGALLGVPPIVVVGGPTVTPTPVPTPRPTPVPIPTPTPIVVIPLPTLPLPIPSLPLPSVGLPSVGATPTPAPTPRSGDATSRATASPTPAASEVQQLSPAPSTDVGLLPASPPSGAGGGAVPQGLTTTVLDRGAPRVDFDPAELQIHFETAGLLNGTTVWLVPTATFAIPALLLFLFVALQAVGALAWVPAVRRLGGRDDEVA